MATTGGDLSQPQTAGQRGSHSGRAGGRRGGHRGRGLRGNNPGGDGIGNGPAAVEAASNERPVTETEGTSQGPSGEQQAQSIGSSRGNRGGRRGGGRGRGGATATMVVPHRTFGGHLSAAPVAGADASASALSGDAPEFVPGQPVGARASGNQGRGRGRGRDGGRSRGRGQGQASTGRGGLAHRGGFPRQGTGAAPSQVPGPKSTAPDLPTRIHEDINNLQYECVICTSEVVRSSHVWSCSICWTVVHLECVQKWFQNQGKQAEQDPDEQQQQDQAQKWRCPGCNSTLTEEPGFYHCWCGKEINPRAVPGLAPHSCGQTCSKAHGTCPHPCSLTCHAGPCPPCVLMGPAQTCFCGRHSVTKRCTETTYGKGFSCHEICGDLLPCGEHTCPQECHSGLCGACETPVQAVCYCGKEEKEMRCGQREEIRDSFNFGQIQTSENDKAAKVEVGTWFEGSFKCGKVCGREFDCEHHKCEKTCHAQDEDIPHCPLSPDVVTHCPCGKTALESISDLPRQSCQDPVARCDKACDKPLACGHFCLDKCHIGPCAPCTQKMDIPCRCGRVVSRSACHQGDICKPMCPRICRATFNCGRHECGERCCPGEKKAAERRKQKRGNNSSNATSSGENVEPEHICVQTCGRLLKCGRHTCEQLCHRGPCMSCAEAIFDEISCACGRTVLQPPQPCGTRPPECRYDCTRRPACGHPAVAHQCHLDETGCPKCTFLVEKGCLCGKKRLRNQPCWFGEVRCGLPCGKKLKCGTHECKKTCHRPGECEDVDIRGSHCSQPCGKTRKTCEHACTDPCHAPSACKEDKPCQSKTIITCPCQNRKTETKCNASWTNPDPVREALKCDDECLRLQRNRRLAEALHIDPATHEDDHVPYSDNTLKLYREVSTTWAQAMEKEFRTFADHSGERRLRFKPMPNAQRAFLHALAEDYGLDSESMDPEPHRHVCVFKTPRFVSAPRKTLAQCARITQAAALKPTNVLPALIGSGIGGRDTSITHPFNALLLSNPRFSLTIDELDDALRADLAAASRSGPALTFTTTFLPHDEIVIRATAPPVTAASIARSVAPTPAAVEAALAALKPAVSKTVANLKLAGADVVLCHVDSALSVVRRESDKAAAGSAGGGWSAVVGRGTWRKGGGTGNSAATAAPVERRAPSSFLALRKTEGKKKEADAEAWVAKKDEGVKVKKAMESEPVEEDWLVAAEKLEAEEGAGGQAEEKVGDEAEKNILS